MFTRRTVRAVNIPSTLITTGDHDDRVPPLNSFKFAATQKYAARNSKFQTNPIKMKMYNNEGHHDGRPTSKIIGDNSDMLA